MLSPTLSACPLTPTMPHLFLVSWEGEILLNPHCVLGMSRLWDTLGWGWGKKWSMLLGPPELDREKASNPSSHTSPHTPTPTFWSIRYVAVPTPNTSRWSSDPCLKTTVPAGLLLFSHSVFNSLWSGFAVYPSRPEVSTVFPVKDQRVKYCLSYGP